MTEAMDTQEITFLLVNVLYRHDLSITSKPVLSAHKLGGSVVGEGRRKSWPFQSESARDGRSTQKF